jgi:FAD-dependent urate hydroxylase
MTKSDIAIIGSGPYGLSAAAHLRSIKGLECRIFGQPMSFWKRHMPTGMCLRSPLEGSNLSDPEQRLSLPAYARQHGFPLTSPLPLERFIAYGSWFQQQVASDIDTRTVSRVELNGDGFHLALHDGELVKAKRVVIAGGIVPFANRLPEFQGLPSELVCHSCDLKEVSIFSGKQVLVIGGGQSALESAALLHEVGADVRVVLRESAVRWTWQRPWLHTFKPVGRLLYAPPDVGPAGISHFVAAPGWFRRLPRKLQKRWAQRALQATGAGWLKPRLDRIPIVLGRSVKQATTSNGKVKVQFNDGTDATVDHVVTATGYRVDISKYDFVTSLSDRVQTVNGFPVLNQGFETSVRGLFFLGAPAAWSFGPLMRFVAGADFATRRLARYISNTK